MTGLLVVDGEKDLPFGTSTAVLVSVFESHVDSTSRHRPLDNLLLRRRQEGSGVTIHRTKRIERCWIHHAKSQASHVERRSECAFVVTGYPTGREKGRISWLLYVRGLTWRPPALPGLHEAIQSVFRYHFHWSTKRGLIVAGEGAQRRWITSADNVRSRSLSMAGLWDRLLYIEK